MSAVSYRPRYTVDDYLHWEGDWELWDGVPVAMSPSPDYLHQPAGRKIFKQLLRQLDAEGCEGRCEALYEIDWHVDRETVVRPDLIVICERPEGQWIEKRPEFVVEILSPSTRQKDLVAKRELYAANAVPFYLIVHPDERSALLLEWKEGSYTERTADAPVQLHPGCNLSLEIASLFV
ncbi:MAG: Uma2 family endonuclease [Verrucomicrobiales bacterium]